MTFKSVKLLRLLKQAQRGEDNLLVIDFEKMRAWSPASGDDSQRIKKVKLGSFSNSIVSTLDYLKDLDCIDYDYASGQAHITHLGWNATSATFKEAIRFTVKDIIIPIIVAVAAAVLTSLALG